jgi:hypothetical protein
LGCTPQAAAGSQNQGASSGQSASSGVGSSLVLPSSSQAATSVRGSVGASSAAGSASGTTEADLLPFNQAVLMAHCAMDERCSPENGRRYPDLATCVRFESHRAPDRLPFAAGRWRVLNPEGINRCAEALYPSSGTCVEPASESILPGVIPAACSDVIEQVRPINTGGACLRSPLASGACGPGTTCIGSYCGECETLQAAGGGCPCLPGLYCRDSDVRCVPYPVRGGPCTYDTDCPGHLSCEGSPSACTDVRVGAGESCATARCFDGLACVSSQCQVASEVGDPCSRLPDQQCRLLDCVFPTPDAPMGECDWLGPTPDGSPCPYARGSPFCFGFEDVSFEDVTRSDAGVVVACTCRALKAPGASCTAYAECLTSCTEDNRCKAAAALGAFCVDDGDCESGFCGNGGGENLSCLIRPACE